MTQRRFIPRMLTLLGLVLSALILTMATLTLVQAQGDVTITKETDQTVIRSGSTVTFTIGITNTGTVTLTNVTVSDALAPNCDNDSLPDLAPDGGSTSYICTHAVTADFTNSATVAGMPEGSSDVVSDTDTAFVDVINPAIEIVKTPDEQTVASGSDVSFNISIENTGDVDLTGVTVTDAQAPDCNRTLGNLSDGASTSYSCDVTNVTDGFINSATVTGTPPAGEDVTDTDAAKVGLDETQTCPTDMLAYWNLDETSSGAYDDFYYGHDGQCSGPCPTPTTAGRVNGGQMFDGSNTGIDVPVVPGDESFNWGMNDSFSIEFWMQADSGACSGGNEVIVGRDDSSSSLHWWVGIGCGSWANGGAAFVLRDKSGVGTYVVGTTDLTDGSWYHIVAVRDADADENHIYVNGTEEDSTAVTYTDGFGSSTAALNIGWLNLSHGYHFDGTVDEVALYDRVLSSDEVRQHRNEGLAERWYCQSGSYGPIIVSTPVTEATSGRLYTYDVEAVGDPVPITYALLTNPDGMTIDSATGLISWTPTVAQEGNRNVEVEASNSVQADTQDFTIIVAEGTICPTDMFAYWKLDETSGSTYDDFYDGHDGGCAGSCPYPATGYINGGQDFNGSSTGIDVPADVGFDWGATDSFSIEFWMQADSGACSGGNEVIVGRDDISSSLHWWTGCWNGGEASFVLIATNGDGSNPTTEWLHGTTDLADGSWHHIVAVRDASANQNYIYVDGTEEGSTTVTYTDGFGSSTAALNIGWLNLSGGYHFDGTVDEVALYDRALSADEIWQYYNNREAYSGYCINPDITVNKTANPTVISPGGTVTYTYIVNNAGDASLWGISLSDDKCSSLTLVDGGYNPNNGLGAGEVLTYICSTAISTDTTNIATVTAAVTGTHSLDVIISVSNTDTALVNVSDLPSGRIFLPVILKGF